MSLANIIDTDIFSLVILVFIFFSTRKRPESAFVPYKLFMALILILEIILAADILSRSVNGQPGLLNCIVNWASSLLLYILMPLILSIWIMYANYHIYHDLKKLPTLLRLLMGYVVLDAALALSSIFTGWLFGISQGNIYHRGPFFYVHMTLCILLLVISTVSIIANKKRIDVRHYNTLLLFALPPTAGGVLQILFTGMSFVGSGLTVSILLLYFNIQDKRLDTDYLTGTYNRRLLDSYLKQKISHSAKGKTFSAILLDINGFKHINDRFGHVTGDDALFNAVKILKGCIRNDDSIARYGGDEFLIVLDIDRQDILQETVTRIKTSCTVLNEANLKEYKLEFSTGYAVYDRASGLDAEGFLKLLDKLMYQEKQTLTAV